MRQHKFHDIANLFPMMDRTSKEFADMVEDIRERGLLEPIVLTQ